MNASKRHQGGPRRGAGQRIQVEKWESEGHEVGWRLWEARAKAGSRRRRTMSKESPPSWSPSLGTVASVARRQLPAERGRRGVVEDEVESRSRGPRHSWPTMGTGGVGLLHTASTYAHAGEWQSWRVQARRLDEAMPCTGRKGWHTELTLVSVNFGRPLLGRCRHVKDRCTSSTAARDAGLCAKRRLRFRFQLFRYSLYSH